MIKLIFTFLFGNALWDYLVAYFGSTQAVVEAGLVLVAAILIFKFREQVIFIVLVAIALHFLIQNYWRLEVFFR